jgi:hypothetical protein
MGRLEPVSNPHPLPRKENNRDDYSRLGHN